MKKLLSLLFVACLSITACSGKEAASTETTVAAETAVTSENSAENASAGDSQNLLSGEVNSIENLRELLTVSGEISNEVATDDAFSYITPSTSFAELVDFLKNGLFVANATPISESETAPVYAFIGSIEKNSIELTVTPVEEDTFLVAVSYHSADETTGTDLSNGSLEAVNDEELQNMLSLFVMEGAVNQMSAPGAFFYELPETSVEDSTKFIKAGLSSLNATKTEEVDMAGMYAYTGTYNETFAIVISITPLTEDAGSTISVMYGEGLSN